MNDKYLADTEKVREFCYNNKDYITNLELTLATHTKEELITLLIREMVLYVLDSSK